MPLLFNPPAPAGYDVPLSGAAAGPPGGRPPAPISLVTAIVGARMGIGVHELVSPRRGAALSLARHVAMWLARREGVYSTVRIGREFGDRDHTSVMHATRRIDQLVRSSAPMAQLLGELAGVVDHRASELALVGMG